jgi:hypothetical protein
MSALHARQPIAGLRSQGKGANKTILDCLFRPIGWEKRSFCRRGGTVGAGSFPRFVTGVGWGGSAGCNLRKGLQS